MKWPILISILLNFNLQADEILKSGDVILIALNCYSCSVIENEEGGDYSHSGVVLLKDEKIYVAQALGMVHLVTLKKFLSQKRVGTNVALYRSIELEGKEKLYMKTYKEQFEGLPFDSLYDWNNFDDQGREKLYCSEFVAKYLNSFLKEKIETHPMDFSDNWDFWYRMYNGNVPQDQPGISPVSLSRSPQLRFVDYF